MLPFLSDKITEDDFNECVAICLAAERNSPRDIKHTAAISIEAYFKAQRAAAYNEHRNISLNQTFGESHSPVSDWLNVSDWNEWDR